MTQALGLRRLGRHQCIGLWVLCGSLSCGFGGGISLPQDPVSVPSCGEARCDSEIAYTTPLRVTQIDEIVGYTITLCHREVCASGAFWRVLDTSELGVRFVGPIQASARLRSATSPPSLDYVLSVVFEGPGEDYQPGDRFSIRVIETKSGATKVDFAATVQSYREERPNGEACPPLCRAASLS